MIITNAKVDWNPNFDNPPNLEIWVDETPYDRIRYTQKGSCYWGEIDGYVSFFHYSAPGGGYGGREFTLAMIDGTTKVLRGPWSGNSHAMVLAGFPMSYDVIFNKSGRRGIERTHGHITEARYLEAFEFCKHEAHLIATTHPAPYSAECSSEQNMVIGRAVGSNTRMITSYAIARLGMTVDQSQAWKRVNRFRTYYLNEKDWTPFVGAYLYDTVEEKQANRDKMAASINELIMEHGLEAHGQTLITELLPVPQPQERPEPVYSMGYDDEGEPL